MYDLVYTNIDEIHASTSYSELSDNSMVAYITRKMQWILENIKIMKLCPMVMIQKEVLEFLQVYIIIL